MPATSVKQRRFFAFVEHEPERAASEGIHLGMNHQQMHDFADTPEKGLRMRPPKAPRIGRKYYGE